MTTTSATSNPSSLPLLKSRPVLFHLMVWASLAFMLLLLQPLSWLSPISWRFWLLQGLIFCLYLGLFYLNAFVLVPRVLFKNKSLPFAFLALASGIFTFSCASGASSFLGLPEVMYQTLYPGEALPRLNSDAGLAPGSLVFPGMAILVLFISTSAACMQRRQRESRLRQVLETKQVSAELAFLKAQINPHLFFKTLNNIYSLTLSDPAQARETVYTLARMMRYVLHETASGPTYLSKETDFIQDYIDLISASLSDKVQVSFEKPIFLHDLEMAPMLLMPFVENAFKHGASGTQPGKIYIGISQMAGVVDFTVRNTLSAESRPQAPESSGMSLADTRRRLELLYPDRFELHIRQQSPEQEFVVHLRLALA